MFRGRKTVEGSIGSSEHSSSDVGRMGNKGSSVEVHTRDS